MKKLLRTIFYWDAPAEGAVFASLLCCLGGWCLTTARAFVDGLLLKIDSSKAWEWKPSIYAGQTWEVLCLHLLLLLTAVFIGLYLLIVQGHFYHTRIREKWRFGIWYLLGAYFIGSFALDWLAGKELTWAFGYFVWYWIVPLVCLPKQWRWLIPAAFAPLWTFLPFSALLGVLESLGGSVSAMNGFSMRLLTAAPWLIYVSILLGALCGLCGIKAYADAVGKPFRAMFGKGVAVVLSLFLLTYGVSLGMAYPAHCRTERRISDLEQYFGRPVNAQGLKEWYYQGRKADAAFWKNPLAFKLKFDPDYAGCPNAVFTPSEISACKKQLDGSRELCELETMFEAAELPAVEREFPRGNLAGVLLPELSLFRAFFPCEAWKVRFAIAERDARAARNALKRMVKVREFLAREPFLIGTLTLLSCEYIRLDALEQLLSSGLLTDTELIEQRAQLADFRKRMKTVHLNAVFGEAAMVLDLCDLFTYGRAAGQDVSASPALYDYRWLFPAGWYVFTRSRCFLAGHYQVPEVTFIVNKQQTITVVGLFASMFVPTLDEAGRRINNLAARYLAMETLIGLELEKRRTGKYPDKLDDPPLDPFGQPLLYRKGQMPYIQYSWNVEKNMLGAGKKVMVDAVAVWSKGPNRKDDQGLSGWKENGKPTDDARAMLRTGPAGK